MGTRSRAPVPDAAGRKADDEGAEEAAAAAAAAAGAAGAAGAAETDAGSGTSGGIQSRRTRARFSLPTPGTTSGGRDGGGSTNSPDADMSCRSRSSRSSSGQRLPSARTSLERLPHPPAGCSPDTPPRRSGRSTAGMRSQSLAEKQERAAAEGQGRSSGTRASAELNALLGLDAAVRPFFPCVFFFKFLGSETRPGDFFRVGCELTLARPGQRAYHTSVRVCRCCLGRWSLRAFSRGRPVDRFDVVLAVPVSSTPAASQLTALGLVTRWG